MIMNYFISFLLIFSVGILRNFSLAGEVILNKDQLISKPALNVEVGEKTNDIQVMPKVPEIKSTNLPQQNISKTAENRLNLPRKIILVERLNFKTGELVRLNIENNFSEKLNNSGIKLRMKNNIYQKINLKNLEEMDKLQNLNPHSVQNFGFSLF